MSVLKSQSADLRLCFLTGDVPEETYHAQQKLQVDVLDLFRMVDQAANGALTGALPRREIQVLLRGNCPRSLLAQWINGF